MSRRRLSENAEQALKARRAARLQATKAEREARERSGDAAAQQKAQILRYLARGQTSQAQAAAAAGGTWQGTAALRGALSGIGAGGLRSLERERARTASIQSGGGWRGDFATQSIQAAGAKKALGAGNEGQSPMAKKFTAADFMRTGRHVGGDTWNTKLAADVDDNGPRLFEHDFMAHAKKHGGKFVRYIQGNIGVYEFPSEEAARTFAGHEASRTTATPKVQGKMVFIDEPMMGEAAHLGYGGNDRSASSAGLGNYPGPTTSPYEAEILKKLRKEDRRSQTDKILGIEDGDPRGEAWPKLGDSMRALLNMEDCRVFAPRRGFEMPEAAPKPIEEMTISGGMGAFMGSGVLGSGLTGRTCAMPAYGKYYELPEDPEERIKVLKKMVSEHGLKPVQEEANVQDELNRRRDQIDVAAAKAAREAAKMSRRMEVEMGQEPEGAANDYYEPAPNSTKVPTVRSEAYNTHPSRFMRKG